MWRARSSAALPAVERSLMLKARTGLHHSWCVGRMTGIKAWSFQDPTLMSPTSVGWTRPEQVTGSFRSNVRAVLVIR